jgi:hypothetical protein
VVAAAPVRPPPSYSQALELGLDAVRGFGPAIRISSQEGRFYRAYGFERLMSERTAQILALIDLGVAVPIDERLGFVGTWLVGADTYERPRPAFYGALGFRARVEWTPPAQWRVRRLFFSLTGIRDIPRGPVPSGSAASQIYATFGTTIGR